MQLCFSFLKEMKMSIRRMKQGLTLLALVPALLAITPVQAQVTPDSLKLAEQLTTEAIERIEQQVGANAGGTEVLRAQLGTIKRAGRQVEATLIQTSPDMVRGRLFTSGKSPPLAKNLRLSLAHSRTPWTNYSGPLSSQFPMRCALSLPPLYYLPA